MKRRAKGKVERGESDLSWCRVSCVGSSLLLVEFDAHLTGDRQTCVGVVLFPKEES